MISQLPQKILKLLEFVGFSGNKVSSLFLSTTWKNETDLIFPIICQ